MSVRQEKKTVRAARTEMSSPPPVPNASRSFGWQRWLPVVFLRSTLFELGRIASMIFFAITGQLLWPFPFHVRYRYMTQWGRFTLWWLRVTCGIRHEVEGRAHIDVSRNGLIFARHESAWETIALQSIFPPQVYVLKKELLRIPFFGWGMALLHPIAVDRQAGRKALQKLVSEGLQRLQEGLWVVIFPEGTRMPPGRLGEIRIGGPRLASQVDVPSYLVAHNAGEVWPKNSFLKYPGVIRVVISEPFRFYGRKPKEIGRSMGEWFARHLLSAPRGGDSEGDGRGP